MKRVIAGLSPASTRTGGYCRARARLPLSLLSNLTRYIGQGCAAKAPTAWHWRGRPVRLVDGTTVSLPDTLANQADYQSTQYKLDADPKDTRDDGDDGQTGGTSGTIVLAIIGIVVGIFAIASAVGIIKSTGSSSPPAGTPICTTACYGFAKLECPGDRLMGACFGFWGCGGPGGHPCGTNP